MKGLFFLSLWLSLPAYSQELQRTAFAFLNVPANARTAALGGVNVSLADRDPNGFVANPALTGDTLSGFFSASYQFYVADIGQANFSWSPEIAKAGMVSFGVQHFSYGVINSYDASGNDLGDFKAAETALYVSKQHQIRHFRMGASIKIISSNIAGFRAGAIGFDAGGVFIHPQKELTVGLAVRNLGLVISDYSESSDVVLPFDIQAGATFRPQHMPLRFSLTAYRLTGTEAITFSGNKPVGVSTVQKVFRHFNFGAELLFHRNINLLVGYNYGIHQELKLENAGGSAGITFGFAAHIKTVDFVFSRSTYVAGSPAYTMTLSADVKQMLRR